MHIYCENCRGIKRLDDEVPLKRGGAIIYASNGTFKTSLLRTLADYADGKQPKDVLHPSRISRFDVTEDGVSIPCDRIHAIAHPGELRECQFFSSTMLASPKLKENYLDVRKASDEARKSLLDAIVSNLKAGSRARLDADGIASEIARICGDGSFQCGIASMVKYVEDDYDTSFLDGADYLELFAATKEKLLVKPGVAENIKEYSDTLGTILEKTHFLTIEFSHADLQSLEKVLVKCGFFEAGHSLTLHDRESDTLIVCSTKDDLRRLVAQELERAFGTDEVRSRFEIVGKALGSTQAANQLKETLSSHQLLLARMTDLDEVKKGFFIRAIAQVVDMAKEYLIEYDACKDELRNIRKKIEGERQEWQRAIDTFMTRFSVPFSMRIENRVDVVTGDAMPSLVFMHDEDEVAHDALFRCLSTGEENALFLLHVVFEIGRIMDASAGVTQYLLFDDPVDSFDYRNKYAFVEYIRDFSEAANVSIVILTHNYDFLRTLALRLDKLFDRNDVLLCERDASGGLSLRHANYLRYNVLVQWRKKIAQGNELATLAAIPFVRELCEIRDGRSSPDYQTMSNVLHGRNGSDSIMLSSLNGPYEKYLKQKPQLFNQKVQALCLSICHDLSVPGTSFSPDKLLEGKIVLSMGIRILAERLLVPVWDAYCTGDVPTQFGILWSRVHNLDPSILNTLGIGVAEEKLFESVSLITPANIHVNSFMYEPIIDTSEWRLQKLFTQISACQPFMPQVVNQ